VLYETIGPTTSDGLTGAAACGPGAEGRQTYPGAVHRRSGPRRGNALFEEILASQVGGG